MVSEVFAAFVADALPELREVGSSSYSPALLAYRQQATSEQVMEDLKEAVAVLGSGQSVLAHVSLLCARPNGLFDAFLTCLSQELLPLLQGEETGRLSRYLEAVAKGDGAMQRQYRRVLVREAQELLLAAGKQEPVELHVAREPEGALAQELKRGHRGLMQVLVNPDLLGGARLFKAGVVHDASWRARLSRVLSLIS